jgi:hypothetical protein
VAEEPKGRAPKKVEALAVATGDRTLLLKQN